MNLTIDDITMNRLFMFLTCIGLLLTIGFIAVLHYKNEADIRDAKRDIYND